MNPSSTFRCRTNNPSRDWTAVTRTPTDEDLFVILESFIPQWMSRYDYQTRIKHDRNAAEWLGTTFPPIYGYRTSVKHPVTPASCIGRPYTDARADTLRVMLYANPDCCKELERYAWSRLQYNLGGGGRVSEVHTAVQALPVGHLIRDLVERVSDSMRWEAGLSSEARNSLHELRETFDNIITFKPETSLRAVLDRYPHLDRYNDGPGLYGLNRPVWIDYINLIDKVNP
jgi:hypothetical protein